MLNQAFQLSQKEEFRIVAPVARQLAFAALA
jgi:hypothetical protein